MEFIHFSAAEGFLHWQATHTVTRFRDILTPGGKRAFCSIPKKWKWTCFANRLLLFRNMDGTALYEAVAALYIAQSIRASMNVGHVILIRSVSTFCVCFSDYKFLLHSDSRLWMADCDSSYHTTTIHYLVYQELALGNLLMDHNIFVQYFIFFLIFFTV